jgi:hypothetical protein
VAEWQKARAGAGAVELVPSQGDAPTQAPVRTRTALARPTTPSTATVSVASPSAGGYAKYPNQLGGREPIVRRADRDAKGTYYRALVGPFRFKSRPSAARPKLSPLSTPCRPIAAGGPQAAAHSGSLLHRGRAATPRAATREGQARSRSNRALLILGPLIRPLIFRCELNGWLPFERRHRVQRLSNPYCSVLQFGGRLG